MTLKLKQFDAAKYLKGRDEEVEALSNALASGEAGYIAATIGAIARARGIGGIAGQTGLNRTALYDALSKDGNPTLDTVMRVLAALEINLFAAAEVPDMSDHGRPPMPKVRILEGKQKAALAARMRKSARKAEVDQLAHH